MRSLSAQSCLLPPVDLNSVVANPDDNKDNRVVLMQQLQSLQANVWIDECLDPKSGAIDQEEEDQSQETTDWSQDQVMCPNVKTDVKHDVDAITFPLESL